MEQQWTRLPRRPPGPTRIERSQALERCLGSISRDRDFERLSSDIKSCFGRAQNPRHALNRSQAEGERFQDTGVTTDCAGSVWRTDMRGQCATLPFVTSGAADQRTSPTFPRACILPSSNGSLEAVASQLVVEEERTWQEFKRSTEREIARSWSGQSAHHSLRHLCIPCERGSVQMLPDHGECDGEPLASRLRALQGRRCIRRWKVLVENTVSAIENSQLAMEHARRRCLANGITCFIQHLIQGCAEAASFSRMGQQFFRKWRTDVVEPERLRMRLCKRVLEFSLMKLVIYTAACFKTRLVVTIAASKRAGQYFAAWKTLACTSHLFNNLLLRHQRRLLSSCLFAWEQALELGSRLIQSTVIAKAECLEELGICFRLHNLANIHYEIRSLCKAFRLVLSA